VSAARQRAALAASGRALAAARGSAAERRGAGLGAANADAPPTRFDALLDAPDWLGWPAAERRRLAHAAALASIAPALAQSIDGAWLGALAKVAGEDLLDWAVSLGEGADGPSAPVRLRPDELEVRGLAVLRADLPPALRGLLPAGEPPAGAVPGAAARALDRLRRGVAGTPA